MRSLIFIALFPLPATAWEFSPDPICTLRHSEGGTEMIVTYDAQLPEYSISVTTEAFTWPDGVFFMGFSGPQPLTISTDRQTISENGMTLTVRDSGFGNVLNGLEFNETAYAGIEFNTVTVSLDGIAGPMRSFRACPNDIPATS